MDTDLIGQIEAELVERLESGDESQRQAAAMELIHSYGNDAATAVFLRLIHNQNDHVRSLSYRGLGWICGTDGIDPLFAGLDDESPEVRESTISALIAVGGPRVAAKFAADLYHSSSDRQHLAIAALSMLDDSETIEPLSKATKHPSPDIRKAAIQILCRVAGPKAIDSVRSALDDDEPEVRRTALDSLVDLEGSSAIGEIIRMLTDADDQIRLLAIESLTALASPDHLAAIQTALRGMTEENNNELATAAQSALESLGKPA